MKISKVGNNTTHKLFTVITELITFVCRISFIKSYRLSITRLESKQLQNH
jgi:hypothetical protein